jgi:hypothetical protein
VLRKTIDVAALLRRNQSTLRAESPHSRQACSAVNSDGLALNVLKVVAHNASQEKWIGLISESSRCRA